MNAGRRQLRDAGCIWVLGRPAPNSGITSSDRVEIRLGHLRVRVRAPKSDPLSRIDPTLAAKYHRLMFTSGKHHNSALCHIATTLLTRIAACRNNQTTYQLRDLDGCAVTKIEPRQIISDH